MVDLDRARPHLVVEFVDWASTSVPAYFHSTSALPDVGSDCDRASRALPALASFSSVVFAGLPC